MVVKVSRNTKTEIDVLKQAVVSLADAISKLAATGREEDLDRSHYRGLLPEKGLLVVALRDPHRPRQFAGTTVSSELKLLNVPRDAISIQQKN